jgi:hypothetical protein
LGENRVVEHLLGIIVDRGFEIALINRNAARDRLLHTRASQLHTAPVDLFIFFQPRQQFALSASQIEHARARFD